MAVDFDALVLGPCMAAFGETVRPLYVPTIDSAYTQGGGKPFAVDGIFDSGHSEVTFAEGAPVSTRKPVLGVRAAQFPPGAEPDQGDRVTIRGILYTVADTQPDGQGSIKLSLMLASD